MPSTKKIMIIDDEADLTGLIAFQFEANGFDVLTAHDGVKALEKVHAFEPDLIILDINMPHMGGVEFYTKICASDGKPMYPILVLTARANIESLFKDLFIDGFIIKPFDITQLVKEAASIIARHDKEKEEARVKIVEKVSSKICLVDNNPKSFNQIAGLLLNNDYTVIPAMTGALGIERMMNDVPDIALVSLGLADIPGDTVIYRLSQMARTMGIKFILFTSKTIEHEPRVMERISVKTGIFTFVEYDNYEDLLKAIKAIT